MAIAYFERLAIQTKNGKSEKMLDPKFGIFIEKSNIVFNFYGKKAKIQLGNFVLFLGIFLMLLTALFPQLLMPLAIGGLALMFFATIVLGVKKKHEKGKK